MAKSGKIARLPRKIREDLNARLRDGQPGVDLVAWLNTLPETKALLDQAFEGHPISEVNLSDWKNWGYRRWLKGQEALEHAEDLFNDPQAAPDRPNGALSDHLAKALACQYAALVAESDPDLDAEAKLQRLRTISQDVARLRRGDHSQHRLRLQEGGRSITEDRLVFLFFHWVRHPLIQDWLLHGAERPPAKWASLRSIFRSSPWADPNADPHPKPDFSPEERAGGSETPAGASAEGRTYTG